jgi:hypothetical protein
MSGPITPDSNADAARAATAAAIAASQIQMGSTNPDDRVSSPTALLADTPRFRSSLYFDMAPFWKICRDLFSGTKAIRAYAEEYIPQNGSETAQEYVNRIQRTECFPGFQHSVKGLTGIVTRKDPVLQDDVPPRIAADLEDVDGQGSHFAVFAKNYFTDGLTVGHAGILIDVPPAPKESIGAKTLEAGKLSLKDENDLGLRAYWMLIHAENIYSARFKTIGGVVTLTQIVFHEATEESAGEFLTYTISRYRVFRCDTETDSVTWELWEDAVGASLAEPPIKIASGVVTNQIRIPFTAFYAGHRIGPLHTEPPLLDLAYSNIAHVQVLSDRRHSLHIGSVPILVFIGRPISAQQDEDGNPKTQEVGSSIGLDVPIGGDVKYVEHQGHALGATREELQDLERRMSALGLSLLQQMVRPAESAEAKRIDKTEKDAIVKSPARSWQDSMEMALQFHANYYKEPTGGSIFIDDDYEDITLDANTIKVYSDMVAANQLDLDTLYTILQNRGALPEDLDFEKIKQNIADEKAASLAEATALMKAGATQPAAGGGPTPPKPAPAPSTPPKP